MIYTVTLNPALDRFIVVEQLLAEDTTRILSETAYAAGKGINVSRVIRELGGHSVALGLVGGYEGLQLEGLLINAGVMSDFTRNSIYPCFKRKKGTASIFGQKKKAIAPPVEVDSTVGAGDSVVGGFVLAHSQGKDLADCMRLACAAGTTTAQTPGTGLCHRAGVEAILPRVELSFL